MSRADHRDARPARSIYRGLRITLVQPPGDRPFVVTLAVKHEAGKWDEWNLLFPALRVPTERLEGHLDVLRVIARTVEALISAEEESR